MALKDVMKQYKEKVNSELTKFFGSVKADDGFLRQAHKLTADYTVGNGKRLRPLFVMLAHSALTKMNNKILLPSVSVELLHNSTLVHDDIMDEDDTRRGKPSVHKMMETLFKSPPTNLSAPLSAPTKYYTNSKVRYGISQAICVGDMLYALGAKALTDCKFSSEKINQALSIYHDAYRTIIDGQLLDVHAQIKTEQEYLHMAKRKTAELFSASVKIGAILAGADKKTIAALSDYAINIGIAFQLLDDLLDITESKGREMGSDICQGKTTLLTTKTKSSKNASTSKFNRIFGKSNATNNEIKQAIQIMHHSGAIDYVKTLTQKHLDKATAALKEVKLNHDYFLEFVELLRERISRK